MSLSNRTALQGTAFIGNEEAVSILLSSGADPHAKACKYGLALGAARSQGHTATRGRLLGSGSKKDDLNANLFGARTTTEIHGEGRQSGLCC